MLLVPLTHTAGMKLDVGLESFPTIESVHEYYVCFMFCAILRAREWVVSDDWQLPNWFESQEMPIS